jgi:radical SAM family uncharacterized protein/radical SAM-linked protein
MKEYWDKIEPIIAHVSRPGRYAGNELNMIKKDWEQIEVSFALAFPEVYEIGMSHIGFEILYHILNKYSWIAAERVFSPWIDMEDEMRQNEIPLFSLESKIAINNFDILGITLQYELQYTNVINLLDLSGIPLKSIDRKEKDPFVIAGGPCAYNPEPMAEYFDAIVIGDGEEVSVEIAEIIRRRKRERLNRNEVLNILSQLEGVYIPSFYEVEKDSAGTFKGIIPIKEGIPKSIRARILNNLDLANYPIKPLVPLIEITHDRFSLEIMRGCTRGCRFCNAGMIYRPTRMRNVDDLVKQTQEVINNTGYDEIALVSLSTSDYSNLVQLISKIKIIFENTDIAISFPSLRSDTFNANIADLAQGLRRSGLTFAPEAGTQRLRDVINKNNNDKDLINALTIAFERNWNRVKLYFMIGLPTETDKDIEGIIDLVGSVVRLGRKYGRKEVHVTISPFSPKPQTPFQWEKQESSSVLHEKIALLKKGIRWQEVKLSWRDPRVSQLEAILGRGDRRLGEVIYRAWDSGARFDSWSDQFDYERWLNVFEECHLKPDDYLNEKDINSPLPWEHIDRGITKSFLIKERDRAYSIQTTENCKTGSCCQCGMSDYTDCQSLNSIDDRKVETVDIAEKNVLYGRRVRKAYIKQVIRRVRIGYCKGHEVRFTSHLDTIRIFIRALRRAKISMALSQGYNVHPKISMGPPLVLGYTSRAEYFDLDIIDNPPFNFDYLLNKQLPQGFHVFKSILISGKEPSLNSIINLASYYISWKGDMKAKELEEPIDTFLKCNSHWVNRREKEVDIRPNIIEVTTQKDGIELLVQIGPKGTARAEEFMDAILVDYDNKPLIINVERTGLYIKKMGSLFTPLEIQ